MKRKNLCRLISSAETFAWGFVGYKCYHLLECINYHSMFTDDLMENKVIKAAYASALCLSVPLAVVGVTDGISGIVMGACGYLVLKSYQKVSRNPETRIGIESSIKSMREE